ncbi:MAG: lysylphosphatidylglycerol synthase domain-containing protein, partial [Alphaproteobacteria bacterium]|nr:lysylphosphatidylglycerol synthase domain-containing protein [Alphaproteobacteria bacterium]
MRILFLLLGLALLTAIVARTDLTAVAGHVEHLKWGFLAVLGVYLASFLADTLSWQYLIRPFRCDWPWFYALWKVRMVGAAVSRVTPFVGLAGEPVKAVLMKNFLSLDYREGVASLVVAK